MSRNYDEMSSIAQLFLSYDIFTHYTLGNITMYEVVDKRDPIQRLGFTVLANVNSRSRSLYVIARPNVVSVCL